MFIQKRKITASEDMEGGAVVAPEATDLLFESEDVAELIAEVTGEAVEVTADENTVVFTVGEDEFTVEADGNEEILEASRKQFRGKRTVAASTRRSAPAGKTSRTVRKIPASRK